MKSLLENQCTKGKIWDRRTQCKIKAFSEISNLKMKFLKKQRKDIEKGQKQIIRDNYEVDVTHIWHWRDEKKKQHLAVVLSTRKCSNL